MKNHNSKDYYLGDNISFPSFVFFILISIGFFVTTSSSVLIISSIRLLVIAILLLIMMGIIFKERISFQQVLPLLIYYLLIIFGLSLALINGDFQTGIKALSGNQGNLGYLVHFLIISSGLLIFSYNNGSIFNLSSAYYIYLYSLIGFLVTLILGGINFSIPPSFEFEYVSNQGASKAEYSAGISKVFGFGALSTMYLAANSNGFMRRVYYFLITLLFLALSILGGSRGDALGVLIIGFLYYLSIRPIGLPVYLILCFLLLSIFISDWLWLEELVFVSRLLVILDGDYGLRDLLFLQAINVLDYEKSCAMFGCGFGFFQYYFGYATSLYPHNIFLESLIVFGIPITISYFSFSFIGLFYYYKSIKKVDLFILFYFFNLIIISKSGALFNDWFFTVSSIYLISLSLTTLADESRILNLKNTQLK